MVLPKSAENVMGGSCFQRAGVAEGRSKKRDFDKHKRETTEVSRPCDEGGGAGECLPFGGG